MNSKPPELGVWGLLVSSIFNDSYLHSATPIHVIEGEDILDSSRVSRSVVDTLLGVLQLGRLFARLGLCCTAIATITQLYSSSCSCQK